jgi:hypothetical protein
MPGEQMSEDECAEFCAAVWRLVEATRAERRPDSVQVQSARDMLAVLEEIDERGLWWPGPGGGAE